jgi:hypothetical protein
MSNGNSSYSKGLEMDENTFWLNLWRAVIFGVCFLVACASGCVAYRADKAAELIKAGADPIRVACGLDIGEGKERCAIQAAK